MRLLYIAHRIPYPPNKGDKIRSYNELAFLSRHFEVDLVCFYGGPAEQEYVRKLEALCKTVHCFRRTIWGQPPRLLGGLVTGVPASVALYRNIPMRRRVAKLIAEHDYRHIFVFSGQMAQYVPRALLGRTVMDLCDVDSHKWDNYADRMPVWFSWFYRLEARRLLAFERAVSEGARATILITPSELELYRRLGGSGRLLNLGNGVDTEHFRPFTEPYEEGRILFTGAMDYFPNEEGVSWFAKDIFPGIRAKFPKARFVIAGSNPSLKVRALARIDGVEVTGFVQDMRAEQAKAHVVVVPLRIARGMQNKVLEAMACGKAAVVHPTAMGGIHAEDGRELFVASDPAEFGARVERLLAEPERVREMGRAARVYISDNYSWERNLSKGLLPLLDGTPAPA
jgi:sugar transferase (PEP-CTERM/EpsH1 system associated)